MAVFKLVFLISCAFLALLILTDYAEAYPSSKTSARTNQQEKIKIRKVMANLGAPCKLRCKIPSRTSEALWFKDGFPLNLTKSSAYKIKRRSRRKLELLKISKMTMKKFGLYECFVEGKKQGAWDIILTVGKAKCRHKREIPVCGEPAKYKEYSGCAESTFPECKSFAGPPKNVKTLVFIYRRILMIQIGWEKPDIGYNDLWGYQVRIIGLAGNAGYQECIQLNSKEGTTHWTFQKIKFDAEYKLLLQSMPSNEMFEKKVYVKDKCKFKEFKFDAYCCVVSHLNSTVDIDNGTISLYWEIHCANNVTNIKRFRVAWTNLQKPLRCSGGQTIQNAVLDSPKFGYSIALSEECQQYNYSIRVLGIQDSNETTRPARLLVSYPVNIPVPEPKTVWIQSDNSTKIFVAIAGVLFGLALVVLFFVYKYCFTNVILKLPVPNDRSLPATGEPLLNSGLKRVFLMNARCCEKCNWVMHCLGELLTSTGLVEVRADVWSENEISSGILRWYEEEIREAECVVVLASSKMARWNQNRIVSDRNNDDLLDITAQLNLIRGEITRDPNSPKYIPAYFTYNGEPKDIPDFLSSRLAYKLPRDLNRLVYHVLNIEAIQPYRTRPIIVLGGNDHPFESRKEDLLRAVTQAEEEHINDNNNSNRVA